jgi:F-type H+-transporting ATPase subunit b
MSFTDILWMVLNFVILFGGLWYFIKKPVKKAFGDRRQKIADDIAKSDEAKAQAAGLSAEMEKDKSAAEEKKQAMLEGAKRQAQEKSAESARQGQQEARDIIGGAVKSEEQLRGEMLESVGAQAVRKAASITGEVLKKDSFAPSRQALTDKYIEQIKELVAAMPSDILNMNELKKLNISISSSEPLSDEEMQKLRNIICETFISCSNEVDDGLIGGVRMKVGDTVYDGSLAHTLDRLTQDVESNTLRSDTAMQSIAPGHTR